MLRANRSSPKAFTLVELLVVIGIIAVLMGLLVPVVSKARAAGYRTACQSNVRQLYIGILNYCNDNHDWYPTCAEPELSPSTVQLPDDWLYWQTPTRFVPAGATIEDSPIAKYLNTHGDRLKAVLRCPADTFDGRNSFPFTKAGQGPYLYSYALNERVGINVPISQPSERSKRSEWRRPWDKILFTEDLEMLPNYRTGPYFAWSGPLTRRHGHGISAKTHATMGINVSCAFMDGHVSGIDEDYSTDPTHQTVLSP